MSSKIFFRFALALLIGFRLNTPDKWLWLVNAAQEAEIGEVILLAIAPPPSNDGIVSIISMDHPEPPHQIALLAPGYPISGAWSPDGRSFAFIMITSISGDGAPPSDVDIYRFEKESETLEKLTSTPDCPEIGLAWSLDSTWLYFSRFCRENQSTEFWGINLLDGVQSRFGEVQWDATWAVWSPDSQYVALLAPRNSPDGTLYDEIFVVSPDGKTTFSVAHDAHPGYQHQQTTIISWSPDSRTLAYSTQAKDNEVGLQNQLVQVRFDGSDQQVLHVSHPGTECTNPQWAPNGQSLAILCGGDLLVIKSDGSEPVNITNHNAGELTEYMTWSPKSNMITFLTIHPNGRRQLKKYVIGESKEYQISDILAMQSFGLFWAPGFETPLKSLEESTQQIPVEISPGTGEAPLQPTLDTKDLSFETGNASISLVLLLLITGLLVGGLMYRSLIRAGRLPGLFEIQYPRRQRRMQQSRTGQSIANNTQYSDILLGKENHPFVEQVSSRLVSDVQAQRNVQPQLLEQGIRLIRNGSVKEGMDGLRLYLASDPNNSYAWLWLGWAASLCGEFRTAERCFLRSQRLGNPQAEEALAWLESQQNR